MSAAASKGVIAPALSGARLRPTRCAQAGDLGELGLVRARYIRCWRSCCMF